MNASDKKRVIEFANGFSLRLLGEGDAFEGIGAVEYRGQALRDGTQAWTVYAQTETGFQFTDFRLTGVETSAAQTVILLEALGRWLPRVTTVDAMGEARTRSMRVHAPTAKLRWTFKAITQKVEENSWVGLAMQIEFACAGHPIHWLVEEGTWEIGSKAAGCTLIQQDLSAMDLEQSVRADSVFTTAELFRHKDGTESIPMDMQPRSGGAAICDFQTKGDLALCLWAERPGLTRARLEKFADENVIHYTDQPFFVLGERVQAPERKLLVYQHPRALVRHEWRNLWLDCFTHVRRRLHENYGMKLEVPKAIVWAHLWDVEFHAMGAGWTKRLSESMPTIKELGFTDVFTHGVWESATSDPQRRPDEGNICCAYAFKYAEKFGGAAGMKQLFDAAHAQGLKVFQWFGFELSKYAPVWKEHPDWVLREATGDAWDASYSGNWCGQVRGAFGKWLLEQVKQVKADTGLDGVFWDSYHNLGLDCVDWKAADRGPQAEAIWDLQAQVQKAGFGQRCESVTVFGVTTVAMFGIEAKGFRRRVWSESVAKDEVFALLDTSSGFFCEGEVFTQQGVSPRDYFRLAAHRALPSMPFYPWNDLGGGKFALPGGELAQDYARVRHLYNAALEAMVRLRTTPGGKYALWLDGANRPSAAWVFEDCAIAHTGQATNLDTKKALNVQGTLAAKAGEVYLLA